MLQTRIKELESVKYLLQNESLPRERVAVRERLNAAIKDVDKAIGELTEIADELLEIGWK